MYHVHAGCPWNVPNLFRLKMLMVFFPLERLFSAPSCLNSFDLKTRLDTWLNIIIISIGGSGLFETIPEYWNFGAALILANCWLGITWTDFLQLPSLENIICSPLEPTKDKWLPLWIGASGSHVAPSKVHCLRNLLDYDWLRGLRTDSAQISHSWDNKCLGTLSVGSTSCSKGKPDVNFSSLYD